MAPAPKRKRGDGDVGDKTNHTLDELLALDKTELAQLALSLQTKLEQALAPPPTAAEVASAAGWSDEKIKAAAERTREICEAGIRKQMKWQPSCKKGSAKWAYEGSVAHPDVFYTAFALEKPEGKKKAWKLKTLTVSELQNFTGPIEASIRYGSLQLTGETVRVSWNADDLTYKLAGSYGL